ncbi:MAG: oleate hydratase [Clostridiales bacterium]|nr:oleate hydratase [Clostridiales bacterium]
MKQFDNIRAHKPQGIESRKAYIVGGGIAGLASAVFLIDDCYVPGGNVTIYDQLPVMGGSMDGVKIGEGKYLCRGERELEPYMECLWYLGNKIPSLYTEGRTITEETVDVNKADRIDAKARIIWKQGQVWDGITKFKMSPALAQKMMQMIAMPEEEMDGLTIEGFFGNTFEEFKMNPTWQCFHTMLAFKDYHAMIEMKRYMIRFIQFQPRMEHLDGILHTKYNEFDSLIDPILRWLQEKGVQFVCDTVITDLVMDADCNTVTKIVGLTKGQEFTVPVVETDMVISTLGSMTQNSTFGDNTHPAEINRSPEKGFFSVWEKLAARNAKFGHPEKFVTTVDKSKWMTAFVTVKGYKQFCAAIRKRYGYPKDCVTGAISILDSSWDISFVLYDKYFAEQAEDEDILWFDGLWGERTGDYIKKPMADCTGEEVMQEFLYHLGMLDQYDELMKHCYVSLSMMPYITSQVMPRNSKGDRPRVIPEGSKNYAFIGQYVELDGDVVFTVETSVRTAMMAAYGLTGIDRKVLPLYQGQYDIRWLVMCLKKMLETDEIKLKDLPPINPITIKKEMQGMLDFINSTPTLSWDDNTLY